MLRPPTRAIFFSKQLNKVHDTQANLKITTNSLITICYLRFRLLMSDWPFLTME